MKSDDVRNHPDMKRVMEENRRRDLAANIVTVHVVAMVLSLVLSMSGCFRWPVVIVGGGSGTGEGNTLPAK